MKAIFALAAVVNLAIAATAIAAPVTMTFKNASTTTPMVVTNVNACGVFSPKPTDIAKNTTSTASRTDCGPAASAAHVTYTMGAKTCVFHISTIYTPPNVLLGTKGYWKPNASTTASGRAVCKVVSQDISNVFTTGAFAAVYSMR